MERSSIFENSHVLIAEDSKIQAKKLKFYLEQFGARVTWKENGQLAYDYLEKNVDDVDVIITDLQMPVLDGIGFLKKVRASESTKHSPIIVLTTVDQPKTMIESLHEGANDFIGKPFIPEELHLRVRNNLILAKYQRFMKTSNTELTESVKHKDEISEKQYEKQSSLENEKRKVQSALMDASNLTTLGVIGAGVIKEIDNPLVEMASAIQNLKNILNETKLDKTALKELGTIEASASLIEQLMAKATPLLREREEKPELETLDVNAVITGLEALFRHHCDDKSIDLQLNLSSSPLFVEGWQISIEQVIMSLVENALDALANVVERRLTINTAEKDGAVLVQVTDTGEGISQKDIGRIFEPFFSTKKPVENSGLGLSVAENYVKAMNGTLSPSSSRGETIFIMTLPISEVF